MAVPIRTKVIKSGAIYEFYFYEVPIFIGGNNKGGRKDDETNTTSTEGKKENRKTATRRARAEFRRKVIGNFKNGDKFITLTFKDSEEINIRDIKQTNHEFQKFIKRLRRRYGDFKYINVIEFQDTKQRGAVHYHFLADLGYVPHDELAKIWGLGFVGINSVKGVDNIGAYLAKYLMQDMDDSRLQGKKSYMPSPNLTDSKVMYGRNAERLFLKLHKDYNLKEKEIFSTEYPNKMTDSIITYKEYNLKLDKEQRKKIDEKRQKMKDKKLCQTLSK